MLGLGGKLVLCAAASCYFKPLSLFCPPPLRGVISKPEASAGSRWLQYIKHQHIHFLPFGKVSNLVCLLDGIEIVWRMLKKKKRGTLGAHKF